MKDYGKKEENEGDELVDTLLGLPVKNLRQMVNQLEEKLDERLDLNRDRMASLGTQQLNFEEKVWQHRYNGASGKGDATMQHFELEIAKVENQKHDEMLACFTDISSFQEQLREAKEDLEREKLKLRFME